MSLAVKEARDLARHEEFRVSELKASFAPLCIASAFFSPVIVQRSSLILFVQLDLVLANNLPLFIQRLLWPKDCSSIDGS